MMSGGGDTMQEGQSWQQVCPGNSCSDSTRFQAQSLEPSKQPLHNEHRIPHLPYGPTREKCRVQSDGRQGVRCHPPNSGSSTLGALATPTQAPADLVLCASPDQGSAESGAGEKAGLAGIPVSFLSEDEAITL